METRAEILLKKLQELQLNIPQIKNDNSSDKNQNLEKVCNEFIGKIENFDFKNNYDKDGNFNIGNYSQLQEMVEVFLNDTKEDKMTPCVQHLESIYNTFAIKASGIISKDLLRTKIEDNEKVNKISKKIDDINGKMENFITTVITLVITISVIPTAITAIDKIDTNYILAFMSTIVFFGMTLLLFIGSMHKVNTNKTTMFVYCIAMILTFTLCISSPFLNIEKKDTKNNNVNIYQSEN